VLKDPGKVRGRVLCFPLSFSLSLLLSFSTDSPECESVGGARMRASVSSSRFVGMYCLVEWMSLPEGMLVTRGSEGGIIWVLICFSQLEDTRID